MAGRNALAVQAVHTAINQPYPTYPRPTTKPQTSQRAQDHLLSPDSEQPLASPPAAAPYAPSGVRSGSAADQGRRSQMEDASIAVDDVPALAAAQCSGRGGSSATTRRAGGRVHTGTAKSDAALPQQSNRSNGLPLQQQNGAAAAAVTAAAHGGPPEWLLAGELLPSAAGFYAVFDGHCGSSAAQFAAERALHRVIYSAFFPHKLPAALVGAWWRRAIGVVNRRGLKALRFLLQTAAVHGSQLKPSKLLSHPHAPTHAAHTPNLPPPPPPQQQQTQTEAFFSIEHEYHNEVTGGQAAAAGTTALAAVVWGGRVVVANAGDSRAVLSRLPDVWVAGWGCSPVCGACVWRLC